MPSLMATIGLNATNFNMVAAQVKAGASRLGGAVKGVFGSIGGQIAGALSLAAIGGASAKMLDLGGKVQDLSNKLGISTDAVQQWDYALKQNGSSIDAAVPFFQKLSQAREKALEGNEDAIRDFQALGVSMDMLKSKRIEDIAKTIAQGFEAGDPQQLMAPLVNVGGRGAMAMAAAFRDGLSEALGEASIIPQKDIEALDRAADQWGKLKQDATAAFAPLVADIIGFVNGAVRIVEIILGKFVGQFQGAIEAISSMSASDILSPVEAGKKIGKAVSEGGKEGMAAVMAMHSDEDKKAQEKRDRLAKGNRGAFDPEAILEAAEADKKAKADKKAADEAKKAQKKADAEARQEKSLNDAALREQDRQEKEAAQLGRHSVGSLQQMGGFLGNFAAAAGPEASAMTAQIRSEQHLREILKELKAKKAGEVTGGGEVEY